MSGKHTLELDDYVEAVTVSTTRFLGIPYIMGRPSAGAYVNILDLDAFIARMAHTEMSEHDQLGRVRSLLHELRKELR